jgi:protease PrsW
MSSIVKTQRRTWLKILVGGGILFFGAEQELKYTDNPNFFPTVILLGALVIPVAFVAYFYGQEQRLDPRIHTEAL